MRYPTRARRHTPTLPLIFQHELEEGPEVEVRIVGYSPEEKAVLYPADEAYPGCGESCEFEVWTLDGKYIPDSELGTDDLAAIEAKALGQVAEQAEESLFAAADHARDEAQFAERFGE